MSENVTSLISLSTYFFMCGI